MAELPGAAKQALKGHVTLAEDPPVDLAAELASASFEWRNLHANADRVTAHQSTFYKVGLSLERVTVPFNALQFC